MYVLWYGEIFCESRQSVIVEKTKTCASSLEVIDDQAKHPNFYIVITLKGNYYMHIQQMFLSFVYVYVLYVGWSTKYIRHTVVDKT